MDSTTATSQRIFKNIVNFVKDIYLEYGNIDKPLTLYNHLLDKTTLTHTKAIQKHIEAFTSFFTTNSLGMKERKIDLFTQNTINYSENVFINITQFMKNSSDQNVNVIWNHLYVIWNSIDPSSEKESVLKDLTDNQETPEDQFINSILGKVEKAVGNANVSSNPMAAVMGLMSSGVLTDVMTTMKDGMSNGNLDIGKMFGTVTKMVQKVSGGNGIPVEVTNMINSINLNVQPQSQTQSQTQTPTPRPTPMTITEEQSNSPTESESKKKKKKNRK